MGQGDANPLDRNQVYPDNAEQVLAGALSRCVLGSGIRLDLGELGQLFRRVPVWFDGGEVAFDFGITGVDLSGKKIEQFERLFETDQAAGRSRFPGCRCQSRRR